LIQYHHGQGQQQANPTKQRHCHQRINAGDRRSQRAREEPCDSGAHVVLQISKGLIPALNDCLAANSASITEHYFVEVRITLLEG